MPADGCPCLSLGRLRTCGDGNCGAEAAASGGLRYYTAPSQRRMQTPAPTPAPSSLMSSRSLSLSLGRCRVVLPSTGTFALNCLSTPVVGILRHRDARTYIRRAKCDASCGLGLRDALPTPRFFYLLRKQTNEQTNKYASPYSAVSQSNIRLVALSLFINSLMSPIFLRIAGFGRSYSRRIRRNSVCLVGHLIKTERCNFLRRAFSQETLIYRTKFRPEFARIVNPKLYL